jgi:hypothetical protein
MTTEQAYINGFVKRAADYGYSETEAITLWKRANTQNAAAQQDPMWPANSVKQQNFNPAPTVQSSSVAPVSGAPGYTPSNKDLSILKNAPLTNMTPKDKWVQGLGDIMGKKPAFGFDPKFKDDKEMPAPDSTDMATGHVKDLDLVSRYPNKPLLRPQKYNGRNLVNAYSEDINSPDFPASQNYLYKKTLKEHMNKYNPKWGKSFRPPIQDIPAATPGEIENDPISASKKNSLETNRRIFNSTFADRFK